MDHEDQNEGDDNLPSTQPVDDRVLKNVVAYVEVRSTNDNRSKAICKELEKLGAVVVEKFIDIVTHVIFKEGSKRTKNKAKKMGVHLVSVLWVDSCKQNQEHVSERLYPAIIQNEKGTPTFMAMKLKKAKSMQPRDFDEDVASSAERCTKRKNKRVELIDKLKSNDGTPINSPLISKILVLETQPRSPIGDLSTPVRLAIPDTPSSMKAKMKELQDAKLKGSASVGGSQVNTPLSGGSDMEPLQRNLFASFVGSDTPSPGSFDTKHDKENPIPSPRPSRTMSLPDDVTKIDTASTAKKKSTNRRKTIATVTLQSPGDTNLDSVEKPKPSSLSKRQTSTKSSKRRKSVAATVRFAEDVEIEQSKTRRNPRRKSVAVIQQSDSHEGKQEAEKFEGFNESAAECIDTDMPVIRSSSRRGRRSVGSLLPENSSSLKNTAMTCLINSSTGNENSEEEFCVVKSNAKNRRKSFALGSAKDVSLVDCRPSFESVLNMPEDKQSQLNSELPSILNGSHSSASAGTKTVPVDNEPDAPVSNCDQNITTGLAVKPTTKTTRRKSVIPSAPPSSRSESNLLIHKHDASINKSTSCYTDISKNENTNESKQTNKNKRKSIVNDSDVYVQGDKNQNDTCLTKDSTKGDMNMNSEKAKTKRRKSIVTSKEQKTSEKSDVHENVTATIFAAEQIDLDAGKSGKSDNNTSDPQEGKDLDKIKENSEKKKVNKKKLLTVSESDPNSFLIEPTQCSDKIRSAILEEKPTGRGKGKSNRRTGTELDNGDSNSKTKKRLNSKNSVTDLGNSNNNSKELDASRKDLSENAESTGMCIDDVNNRNDVLETSSAAASESSTILSDISLSTQGTNRDMSMSLAFGDNTLPSFCGRLPQRQSIDEFNLRKFAPRVRGRPRLVSSGSLLVGKENYDSGIKSSDSTCTSDSDSGPTLPKKYKKGKVVASSGNKRSPHRPSLVMTSLHTHEQDVVISVLRKLGGFMLTDNVTEITSHVICGGPRRTLNVLHAMARGCWLLKKEWILNSLEAGRWLPEEEYEATDWFPAAKMAREEREQSKDQKYKSELFSSVGSVFVCPKTLPPRNDLMLLIKTCCGKVTNSITKAEVFIGSDFYPDKTCVKPMWLLDCITQHELLSTEQYCVGQPKRESSPEF